MQNFLVNEYNILSLNSFRRKDLLTANIHICSYDINNKNNCTIYGLRNLFKQRKPKYKF